MRKRPFCAEQIQEEAIKCRHCHERLDTDAARWAEYAAKYNSAKPPEQWNLWRKLNQDQRAHLSKRFHLTPPNDRWSQTADRLITGSARASTRLWNSLDSEQQSYLENEYGLQPPQGATQPPKPLFPNRDPAALERGFRHKRAAIGGVLITVAALVVLMLVTDSGPGSEEEESLSSTESAEKVERAARPTEEEAKKAKSLKQNATVTTGTLNNTVGNFENAEYAEVFGLEKMHQWSSDTSVAYQGKLTTVVTLLIDSNGDIVKERLGWLVLPEGEDLFLSIVTFCSQAIGATRAEEERMQDEVSDIFAATLEKRPTDTSFKIRGYTISLGVLKLDGQRSDQFVVEVTPG